MQNIKTVIAGQNATQGPSKYALLRRLLQSDALAAFERATLLHGNEMNDNFTHCLNDLTHHIFPTHALSTQKCYMSHVLRKPRDMKAREFMSRLVKLNDLLTEFPPFMEDQKISDDEL